MGGKKKKSLSNRLAKMSDDERARYLQHRAQIEEEAKRRKEQLISTYMKNKLSKEEAFTRLNIAKINEHWHQILRKVKVKALKIEIEDLQVWITQIIKIKDSVIKRLMAELLESDEQYEINLKSHIYNMDHFIDIHHARQEDFQIDYENQRDSILEEAYAESNELIQKSYNEERYLQIILFAIETNFNNFVKQLQSFRESKVEDYSNSLKASYQTMVQTYSVAMETIWTQISKLLREYLVQTTQRKHHYIELKHLDERNQIERMKNEKYVEKYTNKFQTLKTDYDALQNENKKSIKNLTEIKITISKQYQDLKRNLTKTIKKDEKILKNMSVASNETIQKLEKIVEKATDIRNFVTCCSRLETTDEKLIQWAKFHGNDPLEILSKYKVESEEDSSAISGEISREIPSGISREVSREISEDKSEDNIVQSEEKEDFSLEVNSEDVPEEFQLLSKLEGLWWSYNRVTIQIINLKKKKEELVKENLNIKQIIKGILRDAALEPPPPEEIQFPVCYKITPSPIRTADIDLQGLDFLVVDL